jgi:microcystin degradation protein MlrC
VKKKLAVFRLWFEGNAFSPGATGMPEFRAREWAKGEAALAAAAGTASELAAVAAFAAERTDWEVTVLRCASANPGGPIEDAVFDVLLAELAGDLAGELGNTRWDAVYLSLHGAAITRSRPAPELELVRLVRDTVGEVPIAASFDLHANLNPEMAKLLDFASGYRTYPHVDMRETAARVLAHLERTVAGEIRPAGAIRHTGRLLGSFNMRTDAGPMAALQALARGRESPPILDASIFGGFPYADTPDAGAAAMVYADASRAAAAEAAAELANAIVERGREFAPSLVTAAAGIEQALASPPGLVALTDPADNPYSGGAADTPGLFAALLRRSPRVPAVFAYFCDPDVVDTAWRAGVGTHLSLLLGGKRSSAFGRSVEVDADVLRLTRGEFRNAGPMERGLAVALGRTAVLRVRDYQVIVTERVGPANDPAFFALHGIDLGRTRLLCVKAKNHFRAAFRDRCSAIIDVDCPGPAAADLTRLPFNKNAHVTPANAGVREAPAGSRRPPG